MLLLIYLLLGFLPTALGDCPLGTIQSSLNGECYQLFYQPSTWSQAESTCVGNGGHLASITNVFMNKYLLNLSTHGFAGKAYWIGGTYLGNSWSWSDSNSFSYVNWETGYPINSVGYCASQLINSGARLSKAVKQGGLWASYLCGEQKPYICEYNSQNNNSPTPVISTCPPPVTTTCPPPVTSTCPTPETFTCPTCPTCPTPAISTCPACPTPQVITCPPPVTSTCSTPETFTCPTCPTCPTPAIITCPACPTPQVITCPTPVTNYATCPDGWFYMSPSQNCYKAESLYLTWSSALNHCRTKYNATLPSIHSDVENYLLNSFARYSPSSCPCNLDSYFWTGLFESNSGNYQWVDNTSLNYENWNPKHSGDRGSCGIFSSSDLTWWDWDCSNQDGTIAVICQKSAA